ncbi:hypothetical protein DdX_03795 [Ditylenchus destructor]|uniref:Uncharacterized protein n=1 Tax=Ditylenchus destructor TaxID=166010 RepID=A0AAD4N9F7_9BILA|nr:hypothetical protein DdX_03795 [Ditylenchus destructor]
MVAVLLDARLRATCCPTPYSAPLLLFYYYCPVSFYSSIRELVAGVGSVAVVLLLLSHDLYSSRNLFSQAINWIIVVIPKVSVHLYCSPVILVSSSSLPVNCVCSNIEQY